VLHPPKPLDRQPSTCISLQGTPHVTHASCITHFRDIPDIPVSSMPRSCFARADVRPAHKLLGGAPQSC
jgi:hypothetical protein